jgi:hypothetical protein
MNKQNVHTIINFNIITIFNKYIRISNQNKNLNNTLLEMLSILTTNQDSTLNIKQKLKMQAMPSIIFLEKNN